MTLCLKHGRDGYSLFDPASKQRPLSVDFNSAALRHRVTAGGKELLARAIGAKPGLRVVDCTAGLGVDSYILASRGCRVTMIERSHVLYLMLEDALLRARESEIPAEQEIAARLELVRGDARYYLSNMLSRMQEKPDAILIDPMFPARRKHAGVKGPMQRLQALLGSDEDTSSLLEAAIRAGVHRVVVKRPRLGGEVEGRKPNHVVSGRASRFDVYIVPS